MSTITVLCNQEMTKLLAPIRQSVPIEVGLGGPYLVADYDKAAIEAVSGFDIDEAEAFWWECPQGLNIEIPYDEASIREMGLPQYVLQFGVSKLGYVAGAIVDLAREADMDQIDFVNKCVATSVV